MRIIQSIVIVFVLITTSCIDRGVAPIGETTDANIQFIANYGDAPLIMGTVYDYPNDFKVQFSEFKFFVSYITFLQEGGNGILTSDIQLIDFTTSNQDETSAAVGINVPISQIPIGTYSGLRIGIGVISDLNNTNPDDYGDTHPLRDEDNHRSNQDGYIFTKIYGDADLDNDNGFNHSLIYETISDPIYREVILQSPIVLDKDVNNNIRLIVDLEKIFIPNEGNSLDIQANNIIYSELPIMRFIADNFHTALEIE